MVVVLTLALSSTVASATTQRKVTEKVDLNLVERQGTTHFQHRGTVRGTINGTVRSTITLTHSVVLHGTVTVTTPSGKLKVRVDGRARSLSQRTRFAGTITAIGGTGRYADAEGDGTFTGVVNRRTWHATIDAKGTLRY